MEISVVIPVYNRANMIGNALDSLKKQTFKNFDVIIIDDGSIDKTKEVISQYMDELNIKYKYFPHSGNIAFLRNQGLRMSDSEYIAILDSDDWCIRDRLEKQIKYLKDNENVDILATWVFFEDEVQDENTTRLEWLYNMKSDKEEIVKRSLNDGCCICNSTVMMKKDKIIELGGYDERMHICEDFNLWLRAINRDCTIDILQEKLVVRKLHHDSVTSVYDGADASIKLVIRNKIEYLKAIKKLERNIYVWGRNSRNSILLDELKAYKANILGVIDIYNEMPNNFDVNAYHLVTTFSRKNEVFEYLCQHSLKIVEDYIYA